MAAAGSMPSESRRRACCFGPASAAMLFTYNGSRWKLWSEREGSVHLAHNDSSESYTAACWGGPETNEHSDGLLALGCASGRVQVWNPRSAEQLGPTAAAFHAIGRGADCAVAAVALPHTHRGSVFAACAALPDIIEIGILDGGARASFKADKVGITKLAIGGPGTEWLLSAGAGSTLKLWSVGDIDKDTPSAPQRLTSPVNPATCIDVGSSGNIILALCCDGAAQVDVYVVAVQGKGRGTARGTAQRDAALVLSGREQVWSAQFVRTMPATLQGASSKQSPVLVAGFGPSAAMLWSFYPDESSKTAAPVLVVATDQLGSRILCARFALAAGPSKDAGQSVGKLVVAHGAMANPAFSEACASDQGGTAVVQPLAATSAQEKTTKAGKSAPVAKAPAVTTLGPLEVAAANQRSQKRAHEATEQDEQPAEKIPKMVDGHKPNTNALSIAPLVRQGLRSKDYSSMEKVFKLQDTRAIDVTTAELSGKEAYDLLQAVTAKLLSNPGNAKVLCMWIQRVLVHHCGFISSQPLLRRGLEPLQEALRARLAMIEPVGLLRSRIWMVMHLGRQHLKAKKEAKKCSLEPLVEYVEGQSDANEDDSDEDEDAEGEDDDDGDLGGSDLDDIFDSDAESI